MNLSSTERWILLHVAAERAVSALSGAGVRALALKGLALTDLAYVPAERPMKDVDLLVDDYDAAARVFTALGYHPVPSPTRPLAPRTRPAWGWITDTGCHVDLHRGVGAPLRWKVSIEDLFARAVEVPLGATVVLRPCIEDLLLTISVDAAKDDFATKERVFEDIRRLCAMPTFDWERATARATSWRCGTALWCALQLAGAEVPSTVMRALAPSDAVARWLLRALEEDRRRRDPGLWRQLRVGPLLSDDPWRFWGAGGRFLALLTADYVLRLRAARL